MQQQQQGMPIDLKNTEQVFSESGGVLFLPGVILRKVSKFVTGTADDVIMPVQVFYDPTTMKIDEASLHQDVREELKDILDSKKDS